MPESEGPVKKWKPLDLSITSAPEVAAKVRETNGNGVAYFDKELDTWKLAEQEAEIPEGAKTEKFVDGAPLGGNFDLENRSTASILALIKTARPGEGVGNYSPKAAKSLLEIAVKLNQETWNELNREYKSAGRDQLARIEGAKAALTSRLAEYNSAISALSRET